MFKNWLKIIYVNEKQIIMLIKKLKKTYTVNIKRENVTVQKSGLEWPVYQDMISLFEYFLFSHPWVSYFVLFNGESYN